jgi:ketosteroid isomerase-like protein
VDAYFAAAREGELEALVAMLDPDVVLRAHRRDGDPIELHGAARVARGAISARRFAPTSAQRSSTAPPAWSRSTASGRSQCWRSRSLATAR